jgi:hypothetical protein
MSPVRSFVLDCELVAYDREKQKILPFQVKCLRIELRYIILCRCNDSALIRNAVSLSIRV